MSEQHPPDHDLLIRLDEKVTGMITKLDTLTDDHERRIRYLEKWFWRAIGALALAEAIITIYLKVNSKTL